MLDAALSWGRPVAVRYPKGPGNEPSAETAALSDARKTLGISPDAAVPELSDFTKALSADAAAAVPVLEDRLKDEIRLGRGKIALSGRAGTDTAILAFGALLPFALAAAKGTGAFVIDMRSIKPLDEELLGALVKAGVRYFITAEDGVETGGIGEYTARHLATVSDEVRVRTVALPDEFIRQGTSDELYRLYGLDSAGILLKSAEFVRKERSLRRLKDAEKSEGSASGSARG